MRCSRALLVCVQGGCPIPRERLPLPQIALPLAPISGLLLILGALLGGGCQDSLARHWVCDDLQAHASACTGGCDVAPACEDALARMDPDDPADASTLARMHACADCLAREAEPPDTTCWDCATDDASSCRAALAPWLNEPCLDF